MKFVVSVLLVVISFSAMGQIDQQKLLYLKKVEKYRKMRNLGFTMTGLGIASAIYGAIRISKATYYTNPSGQYTTTDPQAEVFFLAGAPLFAAGLPIGLIGMGNKRKYEKKLSAVTLNLDYSPRYAGVALTLKF